MKLNSYETVNLGLVLVDMKMNLQMAQSGWNDVFRGQQLSVEP